VLPEQSSISSRKYISGRRGWADGASETIDAPSFKVDAGKKTIRNTGLAVLQKLIRLAGGYNIAGKQNDACRLDLLQKGTESRRHFNPVESNDKKLADLLFC
jgi:hypothetical protein